MAPKASRRVLFVCYGGGHANIVSTLVEQLGAHPDVEPVVLALTTAAAAMDRVGIPYMGFKDFVRPGDEPALEMGRKLLKATTPNANVSDEESIAYLGLSFHEMVEEHGQEGAERLYAEWGRQAFLPIKVLERVFDRICPELVVTTNSPRSEHAAIAVARKRGIPAVCVVDLFGGHDIERIRQSGYADRVCVLSEAIKRNFTRPGRDESDFVVTGNPAFDSLNDATLPARAEEYRKRHGFHGKRVILWASQVEPKDPDLPRRVERKLFEIVDGRPEWALVIRPHPSDCLPEGWAPPTVHVSDQDEDLGVLLTAADVVVVITSTVGLQAALLHKPVLTFEAPISTEPVPYVAMGIAKSVSEFSKLEAAIEQAHPNGHASIAGFAPIGEAAQRVIAVLREFLDQQ